MTFTPGYPPDPGATIRETIEKSGLTAQEIRQRSGLSEATINALQVGQVQITPHIAAGLERAFRVPARFWLALGGATPTRIVPQD